MDDDDAQFLVVELAAGVNCQDLSETLGTQPFEHPNYQWLVLGSTPAGNAVVAAVAGAEVAPEPTKRLAGWLQERLQAAGAAQVAVQRLAALLVGESLQSITTLRHTHAPARVRLCGAICNPLVGCGVVFAVPKSLVQSGDRNRQLLHAR